MLSCSPQVERRSGGLDSDQFVRPLSPEFNSVGYRADFRRNIGAAGEGSSGEVTLGMELSEVGREWWSELIGMSSQPSEAHSSFSGSVQILGMMYYPWLALEGFQSVNQMTSVRGSLKPQLWIRQGRVNHWWLMYL